MTSPVHSAAFDEAHPLRNQSTSANFRRALTTPISAPPAMKPDAISVPRSKRALLRASSFERFETNHATRPPTTSGAFSSIGMNMPSAKASAGTPIEVSTSASAAPQK